MGTGFSLTSYRPGTRRRAPFAVAVLACAAAAVRGDTGEQELPRVEPGQPLREAPDFRLADLHGVRVRLWEIESPVVVLHFWSTYRDCKYDLEVLQRLHEEYAGRGVRIVGLVFSSGTREEVGKYVSGLGVDFPNLMCTNDVRQAYDVATFPTTFLLDSDKRIRYWMYGILVEDHWDRLIDELLQDEAKRPVR
jgi:peroxiredoxin